MMRLGGYSRRVLIGWMLLVQVLFHLCSSTLFIHSHIIDGNEIVHSHIFAGPITEHSHTSSSADSIERSTYYDAVAVSVTPLSNPTLYIPVEHVQYADNEILTLIISNSLRAPPSLA